MASAPADPGDDKEYEAAVVDRVSKCSEGISERRMGDL